MNLQGFRRFLGLAGQRHSAETNTADTTIGAATLTAAAVVGGTITRSGSVAAYTDTLPAAALTAAAMKIPPVSGQSWLLKIKNTVAFDETIAAGTGWTLTGLVIVPALSTGFFLVTYSAGGTWTCVGLCSTPLCNLPPAKFSTGTAATFAAGSLTGAGFVAYTNTGNNAALTVRTAAQMLADISNGQVGMSWVVAIRNEHATTATVTADGGATVTLTGTVTIAQNVTRTFIATLNTATTATLQSIGISAAAA